MIWIFPSVV